jgi:hypothetical protein
LPCHAANQSNWHSFIAGESDIVLIEIAQTSAIVDIMIFIFFIGCSLFVIAVWQIKTAKDIGGRELIKSNK